MAASASTANSMMIRASVIVACERVDHPWQDHRWRPVAVELEPSSESDWQELTRGDGFVRYRSPAVEIELHRKDTPSYRLNLETGHPAVYVVLRPQEADAAGVAVSVHLATVSPSEAEVHGQDGEEIVEQVTMPEELAAVLAAFVTVHHVEERFVKRKRGAKHRGEEAHQFGNEPIDELRRRMQGARGTGWDGDGDA